MLGSTPLEVVTTFPAPRVGVEEKKGSLPNVASLDSISSQTSQSSRPQRERKPHVTYEPEILHSVFPTSSGGFAKGSRIYILGTGQVMQRSPHYVGRVGTVKEVPVHPTTWYKIEFDDGVVATFRPSALAYCSEDTSSHRVSSTHGGKSLSDSDLARFGREVKAVGDGASWPLRTIQSTSSVNAISSVFCGAGGLSTSQSVGNGISSGDGVGKGAESTSGNAVLLSFVDPDHWVGLRVRIRHGRFAGEEACVQSSGNGWLQLQLLGRNEEVAKRASDLELMGEWSGATHDIEAEARRRALVRQEQQAAEARSGPWPESVRFQPSASRRTVSDDPLAPTPQGPLNRGRFRSSSDVGLYADRFPDTRCLSNQDGSNPGVGNGSGGGRGVPPSSRRPGPPIVSEQLRNQRRAYVVKYIERQASRLVGRPNLTYWRHCIGGSFVEPENERRVAHEFLPSLCRSCNCEMWPAAHFCWNEECYSSPIFKKLPGVQEALQRLGKKEQQQQQQQQESVGVLQLYQEPTISEVSTFLLQAPSRVLSGGLERRGIVVGGENEGAVVVGLHDVDDTEKKAATVGPVVPAGMRKEACLKRCRSDSTAGSTDHEPTSARGSSSNSSSDSPAENAFLQMDKPEIPAMVLDPKPLKRSRRDR